MIDFIFDTYFFIAAVTGVYLVVTTLLSIRGCDFFTNDILAPNANNVRQVVDKYRTSKQSTNNLTILGMLFGGVIAGILWPLVFKHYITLFKRDKCNNLK